MNPEAQTSSSHRRWAAVAAVLTAIVALLALVHALGDAREPVLAAMSAGVGLLGAALLALVAMRPGDARCTWAAALAAGPVTLGLLAAAPLAVTGEPLQMARMVAALAAVAAYIPVARPLGAWRVYGLCCACLAVAALFFVLWEPPPPKPVSPQRSLLDLEPLICAAMPGWEGRHARIDPAVETVLGADEYLNLELESKDAQYRLLIFVTYNANALSNIPHVPWVCMTQSGYKLVAIRQDDVIIEGLGGKEIRPNVILFTPGPDLPPQQAVMFQYFNVGGQYEFNRQLARIAATTGAVGRRGSYLSQTQVAIWFPPSSAPPEELLSKKSPAYQTGMQVLNAVVPLLERKYYPDLTGGGEKP